MDQEVDRMDQVAVRKDWVAGRMDQEEVVHRDFDRMVAVHKAVVRKAVGHMGWVAVAVVVYIINFVTG